MSYHGIIRMLATRYDSGMGTVDYTCDGCQARVQSHTTPEGWAEDGAEHRCPECAAPAVSVGSLDAFTRQYVATALWSSTGDDEEPLDDDHGPEDIDPDTLRRMAADCARFQRENAADIGDGQEDAERAGHDFWLTRNGHGAGFWDGDWPEPAATRLTDACKAYGEYDLYVGDDGRIHGFPG